MTSDIAYAKFQSFIHPGKGTRILVRICSFEDHLRSSAAIELYRILALTSLQHRLFYSAGNMSALTPRFVPPRGHLHSYGQLQTLMSRPQISYRRLPVCRYASATASKPRVLEKPTRFNPPSHGKRLKQQIPRQYGPQLTAQQKTEQRTKKYPHMMPAEGTFMYWFLTNQGLHTFITLVRGHMNPFFHWPYIHFLLIKRG